ncbi:MAG: hypothetical protein NVSMB18_35470 [Acetobacteraceae bacterium]
MPHVARSGTITELGQPIGAIRTYNGFVITYSFAPIPAIPGPLTGVQLTFSGAVTPGIGGASFASSTDSIQSVVLTPMAQISNTELGGSANAIMLPVVSVMGTPETASYDNAANISVGAAAQA